MIKKYIYNGSTFSTSWGVRSELVKHGVLFGEEPKENKAEFWKALGVTYTEEKEPTKSTEELVLMLQQQKKKIRSSSVASIVSDVDGLKFDGDETSQVRMMVAIKSMELDGLTETKWVLADNAVKTVTLDQLKRAFVDSSKRTRELWIKPYTA